MRSAAATRDTDVMRRGVRRTILACCQLIAVAVSILFIYAGQPRNTLRRLTEQLYYARAASVSTFGTASWCRNLLKYGKIQRSSTANSKTFYAH